MKLIVDAYGFDKSSSKLNILISQIEKRVKINSRYSTLSEILFEVP